MIRKEAWPFYRTISGVRLCVELEEPKGPKGKDQTLNPKKVEGRKIHLGTFSTAEEAAHAWDRKVFSLPRRVDIGLPGKGNSNSHGARPVY